MATLLLSNDPQLTLRTVMALKGQGLKCEPFTAASEVSAAVRQALPEAVLVDLSDKRKERIRLLRELRRSYPAAQIPLVIFHPTEVERSVSVFKQLRIDLEYNRQSIPPTLSLTLKTLLDRRLQHRPTGQAHPYALETLSRVWRQGLTGTLSLGRQRVELCEGGLVNSNHLPILERGLIRGGFHFEASSAGTTGDWGCVGIALWTAARTRTSDGFYFRHQRKVLKARPNSARAQVLPLSDATKKLLSDRRKELPLRRLLAVLKLPPQRVEQDLEVLHLLGLYRFADARTRSGAAPRSHLLQGLPPPSTTNGSSTRSDYSEAIAKRAIDQKLKKQLMLRRLRRESKTLASADEWTVLGLRSTDDAELITQAGQRMRRRYEEMAAEADVDEIKQLAEQLRARVTEAHRVLLELVAVYQTYGAPSDPHSREEVAFRKGLVMMMREEIGMAMRLFSAACDERMQSPRNLAYFGWTTFRHKGATAHEEALELLQLSESLNNKAATTQYFLAGVEHSAGKLERAEERLSQLIRQGSASEEIHSLYRQVRQQLR